MINKREERELEAKKEQWDLALRGFEKWLVSVGKFSKKAFKEMKTTTKTMLNWYFFNDSKTDGEKALHVIVWIFVNIIILRLLRFI